jgi:NADPH-dependent 2,4-dienoyl-CoA reductase/sulfur reductase-like enzyme
MPEQHVVIGGNAAGMTAASRAKRLRPDLSITLVEAGRYISYSICGLPYCLGGWVPDFKDLVYFTPETLRNQRGIEARLETRALEVLPARRSVLVEDQRTGAREMLRYDKLLIATGYRPLTPPIEGIGARGVFTASNIADGEAIAAWLDSARARRAVLVGGGYVGLEMAEALARRGLGLTLIEKSEALFSAIDPDLAELLKAELESNGVRVLTGRSAARILTRSDGSVEAVELAGSGRRLEADLVFLDVGVEPQVELARAAGIELGRSGAIAVSQHLETNLPAVYAAGNCAEAIHRVSGRPVFLPLGTVAAKQGRVAGENMAGRRSRFRGALGTAVVQVFHLTAARTGLSTAEARQEGFAVVGASVVGGFRAPYFGKNVKSTVKVLVDSGSRRLLGGQIVGSDLAAARIDLLTAAIDAGLTVDEAAQLDLAYAPPVGALWDPVLVAMNAAVRKLDGRSPASASAR